MADQWFGQNWVVGQKDGRPLYVNVVTGEMTIIAPPMDLSAVAARMSAVQVNDREAMDSEKKQPTHAPDPSAAPIRKKKRLMTSDIDAPAQIPVPCAQYVHDFLPTPSANFLPPPPIATALGVSNRITPPTSPLFKEEFLQTDGFGLDELDIFLSPTTDSSSSSSNQTVSTFPTPAPQPSAFAPVPIFPAGFPKPRMAQPVTGPLTSAQKATIRKIKRRESAEKSRQRRQAKVKAQEIEIQQLKQRNINLNQQLAAQAAQINSMREQLNFLQTLVSSVIPQQKNMSLVQQPPPQQQQLRRQQRGEEFEL